MSVSIVNREVEAVEEPRLIEIDPVLPFAYMEEHKLGAHFQMP